MDNGEFIIINGGNWIMTLYLYQSFPAPLCWCKKFTKWIKDAERYEEILKTIISYLEIEVKPFLDLNPRSRNFSILY